MYIENAILYPLISLSKIEGAQRAKNVLNDLWAAFLSRIEGHTVDVCALVSMGLYENLGPSYARHKKRAKCAKFGREYMAGIQTQAMIDADITPAAYTIREWDALVHDFKAIGPMVDAVGRLRNYYDSSPSFRAEIEKIIYARGDTLTDGDVAFLLEEFAGFYLIGERIVADAPRQQSLRKDYSGPVMLVYPGPTSNAEIMAWNYLHGRRPYKKGRTIGVDISNPLSPHFLDMGDVVGMGDVRGVSVA